jgi:hypothetical protein
MKRGFENFKMRSSKEVQFIRDNEYAAGDIIPKKLAPLFPLKFECGWLLLLFGEFVG